MMFDTGVTGATVPTILRAGVGVEVALFILHVPAALVDPYANQRIRRVSPLLTGIFRLEILPSIGVVLDGILTGEVVSDVGLLKLVSFEYLISYVAGPVEELK